MNQTLPANYDAVPYPGSAHVQTHPDRLATNALLLGFEAAPIQRCRVLELGCGDGTNLLGMACSLPESEFIGIDNAASPIAEGTQMIAALGLTNVRLEQGDLLEFGANAGTFDYIIAHGVYSWVPAPVRDRLLAICRECLAPNGIAYISYNAYPGCHLRDMARKMMLYHIRNIDDAGQRVAQSRSLLNFLVGSKSKPDLYRMILEKELEFSADFSDGSFYHDDLKLLNDPVYFHEFAEHAGRHGLQYLADAVFNELNPGQYTPATLEALRKLHGDPIAREQYYDFLTCRRFRRTLLCREEIALDHQIRPGVIAELFAASNAQPVSPNPDLRSSTVETFRTPKGTSIETNRPVQKAALWHLSQRWPEAIHFADLLAEAHRLTPQAGEEKEESKALCDLLLRAYIAGVTELHVWTPPLAPMVSERPVASPFARREARRKKEVSTLRHERFELNDSLGRHLLGLLDGTRDSAALVDALLAFVQSGQAEVVKDGKPVTGPAERRATIEAELPVALKVFARAALLVA